MMFKVIHSPIMANTPAAINDIPIPTGRPDFPPTSCLKNPVRRTGCIGARQAPRQVTANTPARPPRHRVRRQDRFFRASGREPFSAGRSAQAGACPASPAGAAHAPDCRPGQGLIRLLHGLIGRVRQRHGDSDAALVVAAHATGTVILGTVSCRLIRYHDMHMMFHYWQADLCRYRLASMFLIGRQHGQGKRVPQTR